MPWPSHNYLCFTLSFSLSLSLSLSHTHTTEARSLPFIIIINSTIQAMRRAFLFSLVLFLFWDLCVTSRLFVPNQDMLPFPPQGPAQSPQSFQSTQTSKQGNKEIVGGMDEEKEELSSYGKLNKIGSSPPSCQHKCYGCSPCEPTQVPTITSPVHLQYTNYEPESWKCKCGPSFYSP